MNNHEQTSIRTRTLRFHEYGKPEDVLRLEEAELPHPRQNNIRVGVNACGLNPADWALCQGLYAGLLPRGVGLDVSGVVESIGEGVRDVRIGDAVLGRVDFTEYTSAGAADYAVLNYWAKLPGGLDFMQAATLPMVVETAYRSLDNLGVTGGDSILIHGAGTMVGFAAVQMALMRGARVTATAGPTFADRLHALGATVTPYGDGMVDRVVHIGGGSPDWVLDAAPPSGVLPDLVKIAGDPKHVLALTDFAAAKELGVRDSLSEDMTMRFDVLGEFAQLAADGKFEMPVARILPLEDWRSALELSQSRNSRGKVMLQVRANV